MLDHIVTTLRLLSTGFSDQVDKLGSQNCFFCGGSLRPQQAVKICPGCLQDLPRPESPCPRCGDHCVASASSCVNCEETPPPFQAAYSAFRYEFPIRQAIHALKYQNQPAWGDALATAAAPAFEAAFGHLQGFLLPVPLHPKRLRERGYNQSTLVAKSLSKRCGWPVIEGLCERINATSRQSDLDAQQRRQNLNGAFALRDSRPKGPAIIIDDVMTTGATVASLARTLMSVSTDPVYVFSIARAQKPAQLKATRVQPSSSSIRSWSSEAKARQAVSPGDSIPTKLNKPAKP